MKSAGSFDRTVVYCCSDLNQQTNCVQSSMGGLNSQVMFTVI